MSDYKSAFNTSIAAFGGSVIGFVAGAFLGALAMLYGYHAYIVKNSSCFGNACHYVHDKRVVIDERKL